MTLALMHQEALGLSRDQILRLALNRVAWRNPTTKNGRYDTLNLIISELHINDQHAKLLDFVRDENHYIAGIAKATLVTRQRDGVHTVFRFSQGLSNRRNVQVRDQIATIEYWLDAAVKNKNIDEEPYWNLMIQALIMVGCPLRKRRTF